jgi:pullulanase
MKKALILIAVLNNMLMAARAQKENYNAYPVYTGADLGLTYTPQISAFRIWAPSASEVRLLFYTEGTGGVPVQVVEMQKAEEGTWFAVIAGEPKGRFYVFKTLVNGKWMNEVPDPYAKSVGVNGKRAMVVDLRQTDPPGWENDKSPAFKNKTDALVYELHVRDASIHQNSGIKSKGKFLGLCETGKKNAGGLTTGLDHLKELGITHVHLLPSYDFYSVDESQPNTPQYNWGYDPLNYNVPEGSYAINAEDGVSRIKEFKQLVQTFHKNGLRVVMDVVYNHTMLTEDSYFNQLVPGYYYRQKADGSFSDATACGNETASERPMMRKFMLESLKYWVKEYHIDGFRFDLMGVHDIETMNLISKELHELKPDILLYGEGWTAGTSPLPDSERALKKNAYRLDRIAVFSDDIRDGIKGSVFEHSDKGFASGKPGMEESIKFGIAAACRHPQVNYNVVNYSREPYAQAPHQTVTYCECHDNHVLWDKLAISAKNTTEAQRKEMHKLALSMVLTSQGISFLHAGTEFLRTKKGDENSFKSGDAINAIDWNLKTKNKDVFDYVKALIQMRKQHPAFRLTTAAEIATHLRFAENLPHGLIGYSINGEAVKDNWKKIFVAFNGSMKAQQIRLPEGTWKSFVVNNRITKVPQVAATPVIKMAPSSCIIYFRQ